MKNSKIAISCLGILLIIISSQFPTLAHDPPTAGKVDCGLIQSGVFYSDYYSPPAGTPAVNGSCSWVKQGTASCGTRSYGGTTYTVFTYKWICNVPLDTNIYLLLFGAAAFGFFTLRKSPLFAKSNNIRTYGQ